MTLPNKETAMNSKSDTIDAELDEILEDFEIWAANQYTDKVYAKQGIKFNEAKAKLKALLLRERQKETERCLKIMHKILGENFTYATLYGEIKHPNKDVDINELLREYTELEPERIKFSEFVEMKLSRLRGDSHE